MFDKIIEKIEEEMGDKAHECLKGFISDDNFTGYCHSANYAIEILKEEEAKPFTPESFGFTLIEMDTPSCKSWWNDKADNIWLFKEHNNFYNISLKDCDGKLNLVGRNLTIKNNFDAETILRALGIID